MALKVFDLQCDQGHVFEGWFASHEDYDRQQQQGLLSCPLCQSATIARKPSAARFNLGHGVPAQDAEASAKPDRPANPDHADVNRTAVTQNLARMQAAWLRHARDVVRSAQDVGSRLPEEARRMHAGETPGRAIRGTATREEREALAEEGIAVMPVPAFLDDDRLQ